MSTTRIKDYLDSEHIEYTTVEHAPAYSAQEVAAAARIPGRQLAKTVMIKVDGEMAMAVVLATHRINLERLKDTIGAEQVELATEKEFRDRFPDCEPGATPPFGNLYGMQVFADTHLSKNAVISFCGGSHTLLIRMAYADFERLVGPRLIDFAFEW